MVAVKDRDVRRGGARQRVVDVARLGARPHAAPDVAGADAGREEPHVLARPVIEQMHADVGATSCVAATSAGSTTSTGSL